MRRTTTKPREIYGTPNVADLFFSCERLDYVSSGGAGGIGTSAREGAERRWFFV